MTSINARLAKFEFNKEEKSVFDNWFERYDKIIKEDGKSLDDSTKVRLLLEKLKVIKFRHC